MSHFTKIGQANIVDSAAFIEACRELGFSEVRENVEIKDIEVKILVLDPDTNEIKNTFERVMSLPANQTITGSFVSSTSHLAPKAYYVLLQASSVINTQPRTLASTTFEVKLTIEATKTIPDIKNLVVWVNEEWRGDHSGHSDQSIHKDHSVHPQCHDDHKKRCIRLDLLEKILDEAADSYLIVNDREDVEKVKAPYYTDILILGDHHFLS